MLGHLKRQQPCSVKTKLSGALTIHVYTFMFSRLTLTLKKKSAVFPVIIQEDDAFSIFSSSKKLVWNKQKKKRAVSTSSDWNPKKENLRTTPNDLLAVLCE